MAKNTNSYKITLNASKDLIGFCKTGSKINKKERDELIEKGFSLSRSHENKHFAVINFSSENLTKAFTLNFNLVATEELIDMYRALRGDVHKPHYTNDLSGFHPGNNQKVL